MVDGKEVEKYSVESALSERQNVGGGATAGEVSSGWTRGEEPCGKFPLLQVPRGAV